MVFLVKTVRKILISLVSVFGMLSFVGITLGGCSTTNVYGVPPPKYNPEVELTNLSYSPQEIRVGTTVTFTATSAIPPPASNISYRSYAVLVNLSTDNDPSKSENPLYEVFLNDHGSSPDITAGDGVFTGSVTMTDEVGAVNDVNVDALMCFQDRLKLVEHQENQVDGQQMDILEEEQ